MSRNFLHAFLTLAVLLTASAVPTLSHATSVHATAVQALHESNGPGGGGGNDPNPPCDDCAVRAL